MEKNEGEEEEGEAQNSWAGLWDKVGVTFLGCGSIGWKD